MMEMPQPTETQACEDRDFAEWHRGCPWCAVWVLCVDAPQLQHWVKAARAVMAPWLLPRYERQPHVTLAYRGLMAGAKAHANAEFGAAQWRQDVHKLQAAQLQPFALRIGGVGSFSTVPYIAVEAHPALLQLHASLAAPAPVPGWRYVPHITLGHYGRQAPMQVVMAPLQGCDEAENVLDVTVSELWLARYRTSDIAGRLFFEGYFELRTQLYQALPGGLLGT